MRTQKGDGVEPLLPRFEEIVEDIARGMAPSGQAPR